MTYSLYVLKIHLEGAEKIKFLGFNTFHVDQYTLKFSFNMLSNFGCSIVNTELALLYTVRVWIHRKSSERN